MPEKPPEFPLDVQQELAQEAFGKLRALMTEKAGAYSEFRSGIGEALKTMGINPEVAWAIVSKATLNLDELSETTEVKKEEVEKGIKRLEELGIIIPSTDPAVKPKINGAMENPMEKVLNFSLRMANKNRQDRFVKELPASAEKAIEGYLLLQKTLASLKEGLSLQDAKNSLETLAACQIAIKNEWDEILVKVNDKAKEPQIKKINDGILGKIQAAQKSIMALAKRKIGEGMDFGQKLKELEGRKESELLDLETSALLWLEQNQNGEPNALYPLLSPSTEYQFMKEVEKEWLVKAIEKVRAGKSQSHEPEKKEIKEVVEQAPKGKIIVVKKGKVESEDQKGIKQAPKKEESEEEEQEEEAKKEAPPSHDQKSAQTQGKPKDGGKTKQEKKEVAPPQTLVEEMAAQIRSVKSRKASKSEGPKASTKPNATSSIEIDVDINELEKEMLSGGKESKRAEGAKILIKKKKELAMDVRKKIKQVTLAAVVALSVVPMAYMAEKVSNYSTSVGSIDIEMPQWSSERYIIPPQTLTPEADAALQKLIKEGRAESTPDKRTGNYLDKWSAAEAVDAEIILRKINGHEVKGKKPVVDYFEAAWDVLKDYDLPFEGNNSDFRNNMDQFRICPTVSRDCGPITGGSHTSGQAFDVAKYFTKKTVNPGGKKVGEVLKIFGFYWMEDTKWDLFKKGTFSLFGGGKDITEAYKGMNLTDFVHFQMGKSSYEKMEKKGGIEAAKKEAREYLEKNKEESE